MSRFWVLLILILSVGLMGGTTCRFSSSTKKKDGERRSGEGVQVVVDTRINRPGDGGGGAGPASIAAAQPGRASSPGAAFVFDPNAGPAGYGLGAIDAADPTRVAVRTPGSAFNAIPEPGASLLFATGAALLAWRMGRQRRR